MENNLEIIYYNCQGLASEDKIVELEHALNKVKFGILAWPKPRDKEKN